MAFKGDSDDIRSSLAYKLKRILRFKAAGVLCADPYVKIDADLVPEEEVLERSDLVVIGAPHQAVRRTVRSAKPVVDIWDVRGQEVSGFEAPSFRCSHRKRGGRGHHAVHWPSSLKRSKLPVRGPRGLRLARRHDRARGSKKYAKEDDRVRLVINATAPARRGPSGPVSRLPWPTWWWSPWRTAATTPSRSTSSLASSNGVSWSRRRRAIPRGASRSAARSSRASCRARPGHRCGSSPG